jgi:3-oxoacyl-[acyl-carrier protein] reductase
MTRAAAQSPVVLVTGGTRGIGRAVCSALLAAGRRVVASGRDCAALAELEQRHAGQLLTVAADLAQPGAWSELLAQVAALVGPLDELVLSAGVACHAGIEDVSEAELRAQHELNFVVPFLITQQVGLQMRQRGAGSIVHVASTLGLRPAPRTSAYAASKAALLSATRSFALELAPHVRVNAVAPGVVDTAMVRVLRGPAPADPAQQQRALEAQLGQLRALHPLGRLGTPEEIAQGVLFLLDARWVTGSVFTMDGGLTAG